MDDQLSSFLRNIGACKIEFQKLITHLEGLYKWLYVVLRHRVVFQVDLFRRPPMHIPHTLRWHILLGLFELTHIKYLIMKKI